MIDNCYFTETCYIGINPNSMSDCFGGDYRASNVNFNTRPTYAKLLPKGITIRNCTLENANGTDMALPAKDPNGNTYYPCNAIWVRGYEDVIVYKNTINQAVSNGIFVGGLGSTTVYGTGKIIVSNNTIKNTGDSAVRVAFVRNGQVMVLGNKLINNCTFENNEEYIKASGCYEVTFNWGTTSGSGVLTGNLYYATEETTTKKYLKLDSGIIASSSNHADRKDNPHKVTAEQLGIRFEYAGDTQTLYIYDANYEA